MYALMPWIAVIVTALAGWALIKRYSTHMVLLFAGLAILLCAVVLGDPNFLPKGVKPSGFVLFDIFNTLKSIATKPMPAALQPIWTASAPPRPWLTLP